MFSLGIIYRDRPTGDYDPEESVRNPSETKFLPSERCPPTTRFARFLWPFSDVLNVTVSNRTPRATGNYFHGLSDENRPLIITGVLSAERHSARHVLERTLRRLRRRTVLRDRSRRNCFVLTVF